MSKNPWIISAAALALGAAGGFITGRNSGSETTSPTSAETSRSSRSSGRTGIEEEAKKATSRAKSMEDALGTPGHSARIKSLIDYYGTLTPEQLAEEAKKLENLPMGERIMASLLLFGRWAEVDPTGAMAHANTMGFAAAFVRPTILQSWASVDPENAAKYYAENPREFAMMGGPGPGGQNGAATIASEWAKQDPVAALAWASSLSGDDKTRAMTSVIREVATTDPKKAAELAAQMDPSERGDAYESIARSYGAKNFDEAEAWVKSLPADQQAAAMASAIAGLAQDNPELALVKAAAMAEGDEKNRAIRNSLEILSKTNPTKALAEIAKLDAEVQRRAIEPVISNYVVSDPSAAEIYVKNLEEGPVRDNAVSALVRSSTGDPANLLALAETIEDEGDRNRTIGVAYMKLYREDQEAAKAYVESSSLSDGMKERLLNGRGGFGFGGPPGRRGRGN